MKRNTEQKLAQAESALRAGQVGKARQGLTSLRRCRLSRAEKGKLAHLAWRANMPGLCLSLLRPIVYPSRPLFPPARPEEIAQYAAALTRIGANHEARALLFAQPQNVPSVLLYGAFSLFRDWDYRNAIPLLEKYLTLPKLTDYEKVVASVNLAAAYVHTRDSRAPQLIQSLEAEVLRKDYRFGMGILCMLGAEAAIHRKEWPEARARLGRARSLVVDASSYEVLFIAMWEAIATMNETGDCAALIAVKDESRKRGCWEVVRNSDYHMAVYRGDEALFLKVYFGSPQESKRGSLVKEFPKRVSLPEEYLWAPVPGEGKREAVWDLERVDWKEPLKPGMLVHRLFLALSQDFYARRTVPQLFDALFVGQRYHPEIAPRRVQNAIGRLRAWLKLNGLPIRVTKTEGGYFLDTKPGHYLQVRRFTSALVQREDHVVARLARAFPRDTLFSAKEAAKILRLGKSETVRLVTGALAAGKLEKTGKSSAVRYRFLKAA